MNEHKNIITIEDEIKEFSDKPVKSSAIFKALKEGGGGFPAGVTTKDLVLETGGGTTETYKVLVFEGGE